LPLFCTLYLFNWTLSVLLAYLLTTISPYVHYSFMCNISLVTLFGLQYWSASMSNIYEHIKSSFFCVLRLVKLTKMSWNFLKIGSWNFTSCCWEPCTTHMIPTSDCIGIIPRQISVQAPYSLTQIFLSEPFSRVSRWVRLIVMMVSVTELSLNLLAVSSAILSLLYAFITCKCNCLQCTVVLCWLTSSTEL